MKTPAGGSNKRSDLTALSGLVGSLRLLLALTIGHPPTLCRQASRSRPTAVGPAIRSQRVSDKMRLVW